MKIKLVHVIGLLTIFACVFMYRGTLDSLDYYIQDRFLQKEKPIDTSIAIIAIDDESIEAFGNWPWSRSAHANLIHILKEGNAAVVAFDVTFPAASDDATADQELVEAAAAAGNVVMPLYGTFAETTADGVIDVLALSEPFAELNDASAAVGHINTIVDRDRVVRKSLLSFEYEGREIESFSWSVYKLYKERMGEEPDAVPPLDRFGRFHISYSGSPGQYEAIPYWAVLSGDVPADYFENRIVLIGPYAPGFKDDYPTPLHVKSTMNGVEIHANIIQALLEGDFKRPIAWQWNAAILLISAIIAYLVFRRLKLLPAFASVAGLAVLLAASGILLYQQGLILSLGYVIPLLLVCCIVVIIFRYVQELLERKRVTDIFGRYVAPEVVSQILKNGEEGLRLGGTRRELTVLFVDIRGFTPLSERAEPEEIVEILNEYLDLTANCIFQYDGTLDKFIGDAAMAIFNAPLLLNDHPMKAAEAAWAMKEGSIELERKLTERFGFGVKFGIGIHTGPAVFGNIGSKTRMDYTAIGDTVNTAARLESNAKPGQIVISESVYEAVKDRVAVKPLGEIQVKGKEQGIIIYELEGLM